MRCEFDYLSVDIEVKDDKLSGKANGYLGETIQPFVDAFCNTMNSLKVIYRHKDGSLRHNLYNPPQPTKAGMRALMRKIMEPIFKTVFPATANLAITHGCQAKCVHCSADLFKDDNKSELTTEELKRVIDQSLELGCNIVIFTGGDPFCRKDLLELVSYVDKDKANMMMFTNGLGLTQSRVRELADAGPATINISIDHVDPEIHNKLRGVPGLYQKALEGAARAREAGILVGVSTYATGERLRDGSLERLLQMAQKEGFNEVTVFDCIPSGKFLKQTDLILKPAERKEVVALCDRYNKMDHPMGVICMSFINSPDGVGCFGAFSQFYMTAYGDINPCDFNPISFGNVKEKPLAQIWHEMRNHPHFSRRHMTCRMQTPSYRKNFIDVLPEDFRLPVPIEEIHRLWREKGMEKELEKVSAS
ncbi:MAG TPA: radical SAM protein [Planctomycetota bacterium]|nr:radical SAM protein [Planctomycetota bacterium]